MPNIRPAPEYVEITLYPEGRIDLVEFSNALLSINVEYREWLRAHPELDHNNPSLRLLIEKVKEGSIEIWLAQSAEYAELFVNNSLHDFCKEYFEEFIGGLIAGSILAAKRKRIINAGRLLKWRIKWRYRSPKREFGIDVAITKEQLDTASRNLKKLKERSDEEEHDNELITLMGFHRDGNARIVARSFSENEVSTLLTKETRDVFLQHKDNLFQEGKEFLVKMKVIYRGDDIERYLITKVYTG